MAKKYPAPKKVAAFVHEDASRKNIPTAEYQAVLKDDDKTPLRIAYERRNRDLDPQLVWRGKDEQDWSDLVVHAPPLYIQEKVHPKALIDDLRRQTVDSGKCGVDGGQPKQTELDLFSDFNGIPEGADKTDFYQHDQNWTNRMILGDSLQVMASLAERESLRGKVQCIYFDPPYGIKFNSNFQWSTTSRDVKDGNASHITREPEQVKAFRDTWRDGIHSYLTYLRDRFTVARDLLHESGSIFVQIGDENVHRVRALMDEVFGEDNCVTLIQFKKTGGFDASSMASICDYVAWYAKEKPSLKYRPLFEQKVYGEGSGERYKSCLLRSGETVPSSRFADDDGNLQLPEDARLFLGGPLTSDGAPTNPFSFAFEGTTLNHKPNQHWKTTLDGLTRLGKAGRLFLTKTFANYRLFLDDFAATPITNMWTDTMGTAERDKVYVVQTVSRIIQRCLLMTTDPGDLVLDPTCGSGTTAYVAEQWGRRWITIDTSRVALALARARIMGARYPYYLLADSIEGQLKEGEITRTAASSRPVYGNLRHGFVYERVPHITLKSIANNAENDVIWEKWQATIAPLLEQLSEVVDSEKWRVDGKTSRGKPPATTHPPLSTSHNPLLQEWQVPRDFEKNHPRSTHSLFTSFWSARIARQKEIDASIAAKAEFENLYDKPYEDRQKVRVAGPFTVESLSPHRMLGVDENDGLIDPAKPHDADLDESQGFAKMILANLKVAGVQQAHKTDKINFTSLVPWPGHYICAEGRYPEGDKEKRAGIFIGPEFGTVGRADLVAAARETADAGFDVLVSCAFNYEAHAAEFPNLGRIQVLKARMNADLHMSDDLKNTGKGNLFVVFGEPDITVDSEEWIVDGEGRRIAPYEIFKLVSGTDGLAEINRLGREDLHRYADVSNRREVWDYLTDAAGRILDTGKHCGRAGAKNNGGVSSVARYGTGLPGGVGDVCGALRKAGLPRSADFRSLVDRLCGDQQNAPCTHEGSLHSPLATIHFSQVTVHGVDVFDPSTGEVRSDSADGIACWFVDTDYNMESFFVRHAYFLGQNDPYSALKTTLKAEIDPDAWETLHSDTSRPFPAPSTGRIAVKVINHLGDEVMKVFKV